MKKALFILSLVLATYNTWSQKTTTATTTENKDHYIQVSGVIVDGDSLMPVPFVSVLVKGTKRGTTSDYYGFFTVIAAPGDELQFFSLNHKNAVYRLEDTISIKHFFVIQKLLKDTFQLSAVDVYPWPSREEFKKAFLDLGLTDNDYDRAAKNLEREQNSFMERNLKMDPQANYRYAMQQYMTKVYTSGQAYPTISLLNPVAWAQFIDAWRSGKFKKKPDPKKK